MRFGDPDHDRVLRTKTWSGAKTTWSHLFLDLRTGPGQQSLKAGGKKEPILDSDFYENACEDGVPGIRYKIGLNPSNTFKRLNVAFLLDVIF